MQWAKFFLFLGCIVGWRCEAQASSFIQNRGQWPSEVLFAFSIPNGMVFIEKKGILYHQWDLSGMHHADPSYYPVPNDVRIKGHVWRVDYIGSSGSRFSTGIDLLPEEYHYYLGNDSKKWGSHCHAFKEVMQYGVFPGVDLHWYFDHGKIKMDWVIQSNGALGNIRFRYAGVDGVTSDANGLHISHSLGFEKEQIPEAYERGQMVRRSLPIQYQIKNGICSFHCTEQKGQEVWVIDPELIFSTYSGSTSDNFGYTATYDDQGYLYSGSSAFGQGYPTTLGAYQILWGGGEGAGTLAGTDIAITKYNLTGTSVVWSSFIGGDRDELPHSLVVDPIGQLLVYGSTGSFNFPVTENALDTTFNGGSSFSPQGVGTTYSLGSDVVVVQFSQDGSALMNSTFWGGNGNDGVNTAVGLKFNYADEFRGEIDISPDGNIVITGTTQSTDFPSTIGNPSAGLQDAFVSKFNADLTAVIFSRKLGGSDDESGCSVAFDSLNHLYVCGGTQSLDFPMTSVSFQTQFNGGSSDGWIVKLGASGNILNSTFLGSNAYDQLYFVDTDESGRPYLYGQSLAGDVWIQNVNWSQSNSGMLIAAMESDLTDVVWSTTFGSGNGVPNLSPAAFLVDVCGQIYVSGWGGAVNQSSNTQVGNTQNLWVSENAFQNTTTGSDFYLLVLASDISAPVYGSYFGGSVSAEHVDGGTSRFDRKGIIYQSVCAGCGNHDDFPIYPTNAVSPVNASNNCNNGVFKYDFDLSLTYALALFEEEICWGDSLYVQGQFQNANQLIWKLDDSVIYENLPAFWLSFPDTGWYDLHLLAIDSTTCNISDSSGHLIYVRGAQVVEEPMVSMCLGDSILLGYPESMMDVQYQWMPNNSLSSDTLSQVIFSGEESQNYALLISHGVCTDTSFFQVEVNSAVLQLPSDTVVCEAQSLQVGPNLITAGASLIWSDASDISNVLSTSNQYNWTLGSFSTLYAQATWMGCHAQDSMHVLVMSMNQMLADEVRVCQDDTLWVGPVDPALSAAYIWNEDDQILSNLDSSFILVAAVQNTSFILHTSIPGCSRSDTLQLSISSLSQAPMQLSALPAAVYEGGEVQLTVQPMADSIFWEGSDWMGSDHSSVVTLMPNQSQWVHCTLQDGDCIIADSIWIRVEEWKCGEESIFIPNAFSPNFNNENDVLSIYGAEGLDIEWEIFDRWGNRVFYTQDVSAGWDGTYKGEPMQSAVFHFILTVKCLGGQSYQKEGNITLMR